MQSEKTVIIFIPGVWMGVVNEVDDKSSVVLTIQIYNNNRILTYIVHITWFAVTCIYVTCRLSESCRHTDSDSRR